MYLTVFTHISMQATGIYFVQELCALFTVYACLFVSYSYFWTCCLLVLISGRALCQSHP